MSKTDAWGSLPSSKKEEGRPVVKGQPVDGSFQCDDCYEGIDTAYYDKEKNTLSWECSNGHVSQIEVAW